MHLPFDPHAMRAARAALLQAALAAFFQDCCDDGAECLQIEIERDEEGHVSMDIQHLVGGVPVTGYSL